VYHLGHPSWFLQSAILQRKKIVIISDVGAFLFLPCYESRKLKIVAHNVRSRGRLEILEMCLGWILSSYHGINIVIPLKYPPPGDTVSQFCLKLETKSEVTMKTIHSEKRGDQICFLTQIGPHRSFTPSFGFA
jgi:hypothetical protein